MVERKKVVVGMSGGVDSSAAAFLLKEQGYDVTGVMMLKSKTGAGDIMVDASKSCSDGNNQKNIEDAKSVCDKLGIDFITVDLTEEYNKIVLSYFKSEYLSGKTPNPCIRCNSFIKFDLLPKMAAKLLGEFDYFATGHYVRVLFNEKTGRYNLKMGENKAKDQSYFLYRLPQEQLAKTMFPLGGYVKDEIREIAKKAGLIVHDKKDSQDFYSGSYEDLLDVAPKAGNIVSEDGKVLGKHQGFWNYTIGQRKGLGIAHETPLYVVDINAERNEVVVGDNLYKEDCIIEDVVCSSIPFIDGEVSGFVKYRSAQRELEKAKVINIGEENKLKVVFENKAKALTKGQSLVLYDDNDVVICGGVIK